MESFSNTQWSAWGMPPTEDSLPGYSMPDYPSYLAESMEAAYHNHQQHLAHHQQITRITESKPRLSKEEVQVLETEFLKNHKPNTIVKKAIAESMRVDNARINNWFQNRRAREKKERNIRDYEAKQKLERDRSGSSMPSQGRPRRDLDLVASSAPFPQSRTRSSSSASPSDSTDPTSDVDCSLNVQSPSSNCHSSYSPADSDVGEELQTTMSSLEGQHKSTMACFSSPQEDCYTFSNITPGSLNYHSQNNGSSSLEYFSGFDNSNAQGWSYSDMSNQSVANAHAAESNSKPICLSLEIPSPQTESPASMDIASRRNRRPPTLAIGGTRSCSPSALKTATEVSKKRTSSSCSMRRVSSNMSTSRVSKYTNGPKSPFHDRRSDAMRHLNRSPGAVDQQNKLTPPTPDTPVIYDQAMGFKPSVDSHNGYFTNKAWSGRAGIQELDLETPPTTPGMVDHMLTFDVATDLAVSDDGLITPGLATFAGDFELPGAGTTVPNYLVNANESNPSCMTWSMLESYMGFPVNDTSYDWEDEPAAKQSRSDHDVSTHQLIPALTQNYDFYQS